MTTSFIWLFKAYTSDKCKKLHCIMFVGYCLYTGCPQKSETLDFSYFYIR